MDKKNMHNRILIVDDTPINIRILETILRKKGYQLDIAQNGLQALEIAEKSIPDLILLDVMMPELDGFETCKRLKTNEKLRDIPIIFLTAMTQTKDIVKGFELGAVDYVTKPFQATELIVRVKTHLAMYNLQRELKNRIEEIAALKRERESFLRHELKNRIMPISALSELLLDDAKDKLNEDELKWLALIVKSSNDMNKLIDSLKKLEEFEAGRYELELSQFDLNEIISQIIIQLKTVYGDKVILKYQNNMTDESIEADQNLLIGVFQNLIKNAIEHVMDLENESERIIQIDSSNENNQLIIKINNRGKPVLLERLSTFFEKFNTDKTTKKNGTGLGTSYAYLVTKAHGGEISVTSNEAEGTTLIVSLNHYIAEK